MQAGRRTFLQFASLAPASVVGGAVMSAPRPSAGDGAALCRSLFAKCMGESFDFEVSALEKTSARLMDIKALANMQPGQDPEGAFILQFRTEGEKGLPQETLTVSHPRLGRFALFVSPNDAKGHHVEAVFNRL